MTEPAAKLSISIPSTLAEAIRQRVGPRGMSRFIAKAIEHELERELLRAYLDELDEDFGPIPQQAMAELRKAWPRA